MSQRENPVRTYLPSDLNQWVSEEAKRRRCSISHLIRDLVAKAKEENTIKANAATSDHLVLAEGGWKRVDEIEEGERIAIWNPETKMVELHSVRWDWVVSIGEVE